MELFPPESSEMDLQSTLSWTQETSTSSSFFPLAVPPCWWALRQPHSSQTGRSPIIQKPEPWRSGGDKAPASWSPSRVWRQSVLVPRVRGVWAAREELATPRSQTPEGSPRISFAVSTQTGNPNWNRAKNLHDPVQHMAREQLIKNHTEWKEHKRKLCNWCHISIKNDKHFRKQQKIYMILSLVMSSKTQQKSQYTKCFK